MTTPQTTPPPRSHFRGAILGTAVGDALGRPFEGSAHVAAEAVHRWATDDETLRWTDDTAMTLCVAESLIANSGFDGADLAQRFVTAYEAEPWRGYGAGPPQIFAALRRGAVWDEPARALFGGTGSYGNGAAMRVAPVGLFCAGDTARSTTLARHTARITHTHELGLQGAAAQACAVAWLATVAAAAETWDGRHLIAAVRAAAPAAEYQIAFDILEQAEERRARRQPVDHPDVAARLGNGIAALEAVPAALHAMLANPWSFTDAIVYAVRLGGDTDTIAAMTGALSGAFLGDEAIPATWHARLEDRDRILTVADRLHTALTT